MEESTPKRIWIWLILAGIAALIGTLIQYGGPESSDDLGGFMATAVRFFGGVLINGVGSVFCIAAIGIARKNPRYLVAGVILASANLWLVFEALH